jgi:hypothetical protein
MTDRPIPFSTPMAHALIDGRKTQTRRVLSRARVFATPDTQAYTMTGDFLARALQNADGFQHLGENGWFWEADAFDWQAPNPRTRWLAHIGYAPGDRLYVREEYYQRGHWEPVDGDTTKGGRQKWAFTPADDVILFDAPAGHRKGRQHTDPATVAWHKRLGRFMPRKHSRLTLIVTDVRVERLNDCSEADAIAEGVHQWRHHPVEGEPFQAFKAFGREPLHRDPRPAYRDLWDSINGAGAWDANPWVVAIAFTVEQRNIDR